MTIARVGRDRAVAFRKAHRDLQRAVASHRGSRDRSPVPPGGGAKRSFDVLRKLVNDPVFVCERAALEIGIEATVSIGVDHDHLGYLVRGHQLIDERGNIPVGGHRPTAVIVVEPVEEIDDRIDRVRVRVGRWKKDAELDGSAERLTGNGVELDPRTRAQSDRRRIAASHGLCAASVAERTKTPPRREDARLDPSSAFLVDFLLREPVSSRPAFATRQSA